MCMYVCIDIHSCVYTYTHTGACWSIWRHPLSQTASSRPLLFEQARALEPMLVWTAQLSTAMQCDDPPIASARCTRMPSAT